jgi:glycosyltransferase involved in cell wall biosynthesis
MRILAITQPMSGVGYHRVMLPLSKMPGVYVLFTDFINDEVLERGFDIVMFNRYIPGVELQTLLDLRAKYGFKIVVDIDDYWKVDPWHILAAGFPSAVVVDHIAAADMVTVTHERLRRAVLLHNPNCEILPNALPYGEDQFTMQKVAGIHKDGIFEDTKRLRVLYAGGITHERDVALLQNPMKRIASDSWLRDRLFMIMAGYDDANPRVTPIWHRMISDYLCGFRMEGYVRNPLPPDQYMAFYAEADIAVAPLVHSVFNSCKSNIKVLEAGVKNIPIIVSNVPPYDDCPHALKIDRQQDWYHTFRNLAKDPQYRFDMGEANGAWCRENHDLKKWNITRKELYQTLIK